MLALSLCVNIRSRVLSGLSDIVLNENVLINLFSLHLSMNRQRAAPGARNPVADKEKMRPKEGKLPGERGNARNSTRCTQARKTTHSLDGQHQDMDRTPCGRVSQNDGGPR